MKIFIPPKRTSSSELEAAKVTHTSFSFHNFGVAFFKKRDVKISPKRFFAVLYKAKLYKHSDLK